MWIERSPAGLTGRCDPPLTRADRLNVAIVVLFNLGLQIVLVSAAIGLFYVVFGLFAVRADTILVWTSLTELPERDVVASVTLGGLGTAYGALVGSLVVGWFVQVSTLWISPELKNVGALAVLILILVFRPTGLMGKRET